MTQGVTKFQRLLLQILKKKGFRSIKCMVWWSKGIILQNYKFLQLVLMKIEISGRDIISMSQAKIEVIVFILFFINLFQN